MTRSRLGFQAEGGFPPGAVERLAAARPAVAMGIGGFKDLVELRRRVPEIAQVTRADAQAFENYLAGRSIAPDTQVLGAVPCIPEYVNTATQGLQLSPPSRDSDRHTFILARSRNSATRTPSGRLKSVG